jgi:serine/threonine-protein kinase RsbW
MNAIKPNQFMANNHSIATSHIYMEASMLRQGEVMQLEIPSSPEYVAIARRAVEGVARRMHFNATQVEDLKLAVGEACTNAIKYGCPTKDCPNVEIKCIMTPESLTVEIRNNHSGCASPKVPITPDLSREGGLGLYLMRQLMDEVNLTWEHGVAVVRMLKRTTAAVAR